MNNADLNSDHGVMYCKERRKNGTFSNCLNGDRFVYVEGTVNPPLPKHHTLNDIIFYMFYNGHMYGMQKSRT